jgi:hypothetical protein
MCEKVGCFFPAKSVLPVKIPLKKLVRLAKSLFGLQKLKDAPLPQADCLSPITFGPRLLSTQAWMALRPTRSCPVVWF